MTTNQEARHQDLRDSTSTARGMTADWHALWDGASVADGTFNERLLAWINSELGTSYTNLPGAMHAYAANGGFANWHSINVIESGPSYAVNSNEPDTVADFAGVLNSGAEYYRVGGIETTFASMFSFARASSATMTDNSGNLVTVSSGTARRNHYRYNGSSFVKKGILLESAAATNLVTHSSAFDNASWTEANIATVGAADATGIGGTTSATTITASAGAGAHAIYTTTPITSTTDVNYTSSVYVKKGTNRYVYVTQSVGTNHWITAVFDLDGGGTTATQTQGGATSGTVAATYQENIGNGFYRLSITGAATGASRYFTIGFASAATGNTFDLQGNVTFTAAGTETLIIDGAQFELGSVPTSLVVTSGATATRAAETLTIAGSNMAASTTAMSFHMQGEINFDGVGFDRFWDWTADADNRIICFYQGASQDITALQEAANVSDSVARTALSATSGINEAFNIAARHTSGAVNIATDGTAATADVTPTALADLSSATFRLGSDGSTNVMPSMTIALFRQWDADLGDTGIATASA